MKRFFLRLCIWIIPFLVLAPLADSMITSGLRLNNTRKYVVWNDIYSGRINADLLVLGSSRAWCCYNTYILDSLLSCNSYNLGIDGHNFDTQLIRYKTYRRFNDKPSIILLNIDFLSTLGIMADMQYEREQFFPYIKDSTLINAISESKHITWMEKHIPMARYFGYTLDIYYGITSLFGKTDYADGGLYKGFRSNDYEWDRASLNMDMVFEASVDPSIADLLNSFVEESNNEGIQVIFVKSPVYRPLFDHFTGIPQMDSIFFAIAARNNVPVYDYYYSSIGLDSTNFYNPSHLNTKGAELFTTELCRDLLDGDLCTSNKCN